MALLGESRRVLDYVIAETEKDGLMQFSQPDMEPGLGTTLMLGERDWIDFGSPAQVTITISAGDLLNAEKPAPDPREE